MPIKQPVQFRLVRLVPLGIAQKNPFRSLSYIDQKKGSPSVTRLGRDMVVTVTRHGIGSPFLRYIFFLGFCFFFFVLIASHGGNRGIFLKKDSPPLNIQWSDQPGPMRSWQTSQPEKWKESCEVVVSNIIFGIFTPKIGEDFQFDYCNIFQRGWNHQLQ